MSLNNFFKTTHHGSVASTFCKWALIRLPSKLKFTYVMHAKIVWICTYSADFTNYLDDTHSSRVPVVLFLQAVSPRESPTQAPGPARHDQASQAVALSPSAKPVPEQEREDGAGQD